MRDDQRYLGIYDADGGLTGELRYVVGKLAGRTHCALCDITHGWTGRKRTWDAACADAGMEIALAHRNEVGPDELAAAGSLPAVIGRGPDGAWRLLLGPDALDACGGDPEAFVAALRAVPLGPDGG